MKTVIQQAANELADVYLNNLEKFTITDILIFLHSYLEAEKNQIEEAFNNGFNCNISAVTGKEYYDTTFKNE